MKEYSLNVLEQYDIKVSDTKKTRGAILCDTDQGLLLLKETAFSEKKIYAMNILQEQIIEQGYKNIDKVLINKEGGFITKAEDGTSYILKQWYQAKECDVKKEREIIQAVRELAKLHLLMKVEKQDEVWDHFYGKDIEDEYIRHNKELRKVRTFIRKKPVKGIFEEELLKNFDKIYRMAEQTTEKFLKSGYRELYRRSRENGEVIHGEYNYHNILVFPYNMAVTNFEHCSINIQAEDLYYFIRKVMEKYQWNIRLCKEMIGAYQAVRPMEKEELDYIAFRISYPEKIWKIVNLYYHTNKAWIPAKNIEKLKIAIDQTDRRNGLLETIFSFHL